MYRGGAMKTKTVRDAVHGDIELGALELELIDTPEFQRLRGIRQLGTAFFVYPSATHTRFEHSLGTCWMARRMIGALRRTCNIPADEETAIRAAALLHDITHIPFGHTLEDERRVLPRHDRDDARLRYFLHESRLARILLRAGMHDQVLRILGGTAGYASDIITGPITADLLDYLRRDAYFTGLAQFYDERIFHSFVVEGGRFVVNLEKHGMLRRDTLSEMVNLLRIRYNLSERVYFHHTKISSGAMVSKAVETTLRSGLAAEELWSLKDETLLRVLAERGSTGVKHLVSCLESRQLYRPGLVSTSGEMLERYHYDAAAREEAEARIASDLGVEPHKVIIYCPSPGMSLPEAEVTVRLPDGSLVPLSGSNNDEIRILKDKHKSLWHLSVLLDRGQTPTKSMIAVICEAIGA
jgi:HD superfamily phosphohydrolase